jgi:hypothetical protein
MARCDHSAWLELWQGDTEPLLSHGWRLPQISNDLPDPSNQFPQITFLLGRRLKEKALRTLCQSSFKGPRRKHAINIRTDNRTLHALQPRLFADCDPMSQGLQQVPPGTRTCHQDEVISIPASHQNIMLHDLILCRLLFMFVDVICIFADDFGGLNAVQNLLLTWAGIGSGSSLPHAVRPRVIIVASDEGQSVTHNVLDEKDFLFELQSKEPALYKTFSDIRFSRLPSDELSSSARFLSLSAEISRQLHDARFVRIQNQVLFSAVHLSEFFKLASRKLSITPLDQFDFVASARQQNLLDGGFSSHVIEFLRLGGKSRIPYDGMASHIASAILMDAYPPGMHCLYTRFPSRGHLANFISVLPSNSFLYALPRRLLLSTPKDL